MGSSRLFIFVLGILSFASCFGMDRPGGITHTANSAASHTWEVLLSPAYTISPGGAYLSSELRYQANEDFGLGLGFGAGELGFNVGANSVWYIAPDLDNQPAFALLGGLYLNRLETFNYFIVKVAPVVSKNFKTDFGRVTPYAAYHFTPSFRLGPAGNEISMKASVGSEFFVQNWDGLRLWTEFGLGILNNVHEVVLGISYPFNSLGG